MAESSSVTPSADKPVIVRVKRKVSQSALDAFWLEINERPLKRPLIDFGKLSISDASSSKVEESKTQKILVRHVETVTSSKDAFDILRSFVPNSCGELKSDEKNEERRRSLKTVDKQDQLLVKARQRQEVLSRGARFEQIWRSRQEKKVAPENEAIYDMCRLYDVVRVDVEEQNQKDTDMDQDDCKMMADFLPLLREILPTAAEEIEHDIHGVMSKQASSDGYVYDVYAVEKEVNEMEPDSTSHFPLVQVDDDDDQFYDGPDDSECESDDSNAENNPLNDYPDEEDEDEDEDEDATSRSSDENSEGESTTSGSEAEELKSGSQVSYEEDSELYEWSDCADQTLEDSEGDEETYL